MNFSHEKDPGKNFTGIAVVVLLHALVAWGIVSGLGTRMVTKMAEAVETKIIEEVKPPPPTGSAAAATTAGNEGAAATIHSAGRSERAAASAGAERDRERDQRQAGNQRACRVRHRRHRPQRQSANAAGPMRVAAVADFNTCAKPEWPKASLRNEETGTVTLSFLIGVDGRVADSKIVKSSGFRDLDKAAVAGIRQVPLQAGHGRRQAGTSVDANAIRLDAGIKTEAAVRSHTVIFVVIMFSELIIL